MGQPNAAEIARNNSLSSSVTWPSAAMQAVTAVDDPPLDAGAGLGQLGQRGIEGSGAYIAGFAASAAWPDRLCTPVSKRPLNVFRLLLADIGQRGKDDGRRLGNRADGLITDRRRLLQSKMDVQIPKQHGPQTVLEQIDLAVGFHQRLDDLAELAVLLRRAPLERGHGQIEERQPGSRIERLGQGGQLLGLLKQRRLDLAFEQLDLLRRVVSFAWLSRTA